MNLWQAIELGVLQAATEFLPVSSSGHLVLYREVTGRSVEGHLLFDVMLHVGTLVAVLAVYWRDVLLALVGGLRGIWAVVHRRPLRPLWAGDADLRLAVWLVVASVPAAVAGILLGKAVERLGERPAAVGALLLVNGWVLFLAGRGRLFKRCREPSVRVPDTLGVPLAVGLAQAAALLPGLSRSGLTISTALACGQERTAAARFSFLLSVPAILGAAILTLLRAPAAPTLSQPAPWGPILVGMVISAVVGYGALRLLLRVLKRGRFTLFAYYCWLAALAVIIWVKVL